VGCRRVEWEILAELGRLAASERDDQAAADLLGEARRVVEAIADSSATTSFGRGSSPSRPSVSSNPSVPTAERSAVRAPGSSHRGSSVR